MMDSLKVYSINAKGLNIPEKRHMLMNDLRQEKVDVTFIQETHFKEDRPLILKNKFFPLTYHSTNKTKSRGVSILLSG